MGTYYTAHILGDKNLFGVFSWAINIPLIIALVFTPTLVAKMHGMYKLNVGSYALATAARALVAVAGYTGTGDVKDDAALHGHRCTGSGPVAGRHERRYRLLLRVHLADEAQACGRNDVLLHFSGVNLARSARITGWLLAASHFDSSLAVQPESCISMLRIMYLVIPFALDAIITFILSRLKVEEVNEQLRAAMDN